jgi:SAM-dependent methyltransferase
MLVTTAAGARFDAERFERRARDAERELRALRRHLDLNATYLEIGAGDCALARRVAGYADRVYAVDTSEDMMGRLGGPPNLVRLAHDGVRIPLPGESVDVAFSRELVISQLPGICNALRDGGVYVTCSQGPACELRKAFLDAGFSKIRFSVGIVRVPYVLAIALDDRFRIAAVR